VKHTLAERLTSAVSGPKPGWLDWQAWRVIARQFQQIREGRLTVTGPFGSRTFGSGGGLTATIAIEDPAICRRILVGGSLAATRGYVDGAWTTDDLAAVCRIFTRNMAAATGLDRGLARLAAPLARLARWRQRNTRRGSRRNIEAHYDLGNDFFALLLDETMSYSCAVFEPEDVTLAEASRAKIHRLCRQLDLRPSDHLLEIGTGWGELAIVAARHYGCRVTTATISREQYDLARRRVEQAGLADRVTVVLSDYRDLTGRYDKLVSVEMIEAVGAEYLSTFFDVCADRLVPGGRLAIQAITVADDRYASYLGTVDFIQQDVFPGSCLVSVGAMQDAARRAGSLRMRGVDDLTPHYVRTLRAWRTRLADRLDDVRRLGHDDRFVRRWEMYLCACEAGFAEQTTGLVQIVFDRHAAPEDTRP